MSRHRTSAGVNISDLYRKTARELQAAAEVARRNQIDLEVKDRFTTKDEHWCLGRKVTDTHWRLETIEPFVKAGVLSTAGKSKAECVARMHMALALYYQNRKACPDWEACLDRAGNATIKVADWAGDSGVIYSTGSGK